MIKPLLLRELYDRFGGELVVNEPADAAVISFNSLSIDTRQIQKNDLFVAIIGDRFDGHDYAVLAENKGATALVVSRVIEGVTIPQWVVDDTTIALGHIALMATEDFSGKLVAITGSSGKTTVKGMLQSILSVAVNDAVFATQGNLNNHFGVPLSLLSLTQKHVYAVIEMGASALGEIDYLTHLANPDVALINNVRPAHVEGFGSMDNIATAKGEIYNGLSNDGLAIINIDDHYSSQWITQNQQRKTLCFSTDDQSDAAVRASDVVVKNNVGSEFVLHLDDQKAVVHLPVLGEHNVANALAAASCAHALKISMDCVVQGLEAFDGVSGRLQAVLGVNGSSIIDDSYNANPASVCAAIDVLAQRNEKTVLVLGDMGELGELAVSAHQDVVQYAKEKNIDCLLTVGTYTQAAAEHFSGLGLSAHFDDHEQLITQAMGMASSDTAFLIKGSRSSRMDIVVQALKQRGDNEC